VLVQATSRKKIMKRQKPSGAQFKKKRKEEKGNVPRRKVNPVPSQE